MLYSILGLFVIQHCCVTTWNDLLNIPKHSVNVRSHLLWLCKISGVNSIYNNYPCDQEFRLRAKKCLQISLIKNASTPSDRLHVPNNPHDVLHLKERKIIFAFVLYSKVAPTEPQRDYFITVAILFLIKPKGNPSLSVGETLKYHLSHGQRTTLTQCCKKSSFCSITKRTACVGSISRHNK